MKALFYSIILVAVIIAGCGNQKFEKSFEFSEATWQRFEPVEFEFENASTTKPYVVNMVLELTDDYEFDDFRFMLNRETAEGETWIKSWFLPIRNAQQQIDAKKENGVYTFKMTLTRQMYFGSEAKHKFILTNLLPKVENKGIKSLKIIIEN